MTQTDMLASVKWHFSIVKWHFRNVKWHFRNAYCKVHIAIRKHRYPRYLFLIKKSIWKVGQMKENGYLCVSFTRVELRF